MYTKNLYEMLNMDFNGKKNIFATGNPDKRYYSISSDADYQKEKLGKPTRLFTPVAYTHLFAEFLALIALSWERDLHLRKLQSGIR